jgi:tetratricopeptide (TPR) repeat protein
MKSGGLQGLVEFRRSALVWLLLAAATLAVYGRVASFAFTNYDDPRMISENPVVVSGLTLRGFFWALTTFYYEYWHPLTWLSHMLDCQLFGLWAGGHHLMSVGFHVANTVLLFAVLERMTGAWKRSALVAALFALHPLHVESVAWIAERKDVLSTFFFMLTLLAYARYAEGRRPKAEVRIQRPAFGLHLPSSTFYLLSLLCFALGLMSKPMVMTLPFVLLLLDYWPLGRSAEGGGRRAESGKKGQGKFRPTGWGQLLLEKLPFFALTVVSCVLTYTWARSSGNLLTGKAEPWGLRLANVPVSYARYLGKLIWPVGLVLPYPMPHHWAWWQTGGAVLVWGVITLFAAGRARSAPYLIVGWLIFLGVLVPTIRVVHAGYQSIADRYTYIPSIGIFIAVVWWAAEWGSGRARLGLRLGWRSGYGAGAVALLLCGYLTWGQVGVWRNNFTLWTHSLAVCPDNGVAHFNLGDDFLQKGNLDEAVKQFQEAIRLDPAAPFAYNGLGKAYALQGKLDEAMALFSRAIKLDPELTGAHHNLGNAYMIKGRLPEAIAELKTALRLKPDHIEVAKKLAEVLMRTGKAAEALPYCEAVVKAEPQDAHAHFLLGSACLATKRLAPAAASFKEALRLAPNTPECLNALAWIYATSPQPQLRNGAEAVRLAEQACQLTQRQQTTLLDTLAAAYAEAGRFADAVKTTEAIRALALSAHDTNTVDTARQRLELYRAGKPYRDE